MANDIPIAFDAQDETYKMTRKLLM